ncbi:MAG: DUF2752 domain-containing protein [Bacteroidia bacterium]|nr:DUF2752 domain-containing protein [Bacteroidia bacterium]
MNELIHWLENHLLACPYKSMFGISCPGCGMQRSFIALLKGDFVESFLLYPALFPVFFTFLLLILHLKFKLKNGACYIKYSFIVSISTMGVSYIIKLFL